MRTHSVTRSRGQIQKSSSRATYRNGSSSKVHDAKSYRVTKSRGKPRTARSLVRKGLPLDKGALEGYAEEVAGEEEASLQQATSGGAPGSVGWWTLDTHIKVNGRWMALAPENLAPRKNVYRDESANEVDVSTWEKCVGLAERVGVDAAVTMIVDEGYEKAREYFGDGLSEALARKQAEAMEKLGELVLDEGDQAAMGLMNLSLAMRAADRDDNQSDWIRVSEAEAERLSKEVAEGKRRLFEL